MRKENPARAAAIRQIDDRLARELLPAQPLTVSQLAAYRGNRFVAGWRFHATFPDGVRRLDLLMGLNAPWQPLRVALVDRPDFLTWPHVERDGLLCLLPNSASIDPFRPDDVALSLLALAAGLIEDLADGSRVEEFRDEFKTYWDYRCDQRTRPLYTLLSPEGPSRIISVWRGEQFTLVGDNEEVLRTWLRHRFPNMVERNIKFDAAAFVWLQQPPIPAEFPENAQGIIELAARSQVDFLPLAQTVFQVAPECTVVLGADSSNGPGFLGLSLIPPALDRGGNPVTKGFRTDKVPRSLGLRRTLKGRTLRCTADRADASWIHGRDQDLRITTLRQSTVAVIGCGSVGAPVAAMLAAAGIGRLLLIDPDHLSWPNIGRHILGAPQVGKNKARALAEHLLARFPHMHGVDYKDEPWQDAIHESVDVFDTCDVIISAMGDWAAESQLNQWHRSQRRRVACLYAWTEPHACAGHAVAIVADGGCLQCGCSDTGTPHLQVTSWPAGPSTKQEPACGSVYQPYGPVELNHIVSMAAELALDCVLEVTATSQHRVWSGSRKLLEAAGGAWTPEWDHIVGDRFHGCSVEEREWPRSTSCKCCHTEVA